MNLMIYDSYVNQLCSEFVKKTDRVFDCGCGNGLHTSIIKKYSNNVIGGDLDNRTKREYYINFKKISVNQYGKEGEFDVVTSFDVIEHVKDDFNFVKELIKITKHQGIIIIGTPNKNRLSNKIISLFKGKINYPRNLGYDYSSGGNIIHLREYTKDDLLRLSKKITNIKSSHVKSGFFGLYTSFGAIGFKGLNQKIFAEYAQHLFLIIKKS